MGELRMPVESPILDADGKPIVKWLPVRVDPACPKDLVFLVRKNQSDLFPKIVEVFRAPVFPSRR